MMTIDEFVDQNRKMWKQPGFEKQVRDFNRVFIPQIKRDGFYSIPMKFFSHSPSSVTVSMHGPPIKSKETFHPVFHNHDYFELVYVYRGSCVNVFQDNEICLPQGTLLLLNPNVLHTPYTIKEEDVVLNMMLSEDIFQKSLAPLLIDNSLFTNFFSQYFYQISQTQDYLLFKPDDQAQVEQVVRGMIEESINRLACYEHVVQAQLVILFAILARSYSEQHDIHADMGGKAMLIANVISYINQHCADVSLPQLKEEFSYSAGYLSKLIQKHTGKSFSELTNYFRLEKVRTALEDSSLSILELVQLSGFNDVSYLNKAFKKRYGMTPAQYRRSKIQGTE